MNHVKINTKKPAGNFHVYIDEFGQMVHMEEVSSSEEKNSSKKQNQEAA